MLTVVTDFPTPPFWLEIAMARAGRPGFAPSLSPTGCPSTDMVCNSFMRQIMHTSTCTYQGQNGCRVAVLNTSINSHSYKHTFFLSLGHTVDVPMLFSFSCMNCSCFSRYSALIYCHARTYINSHWYCHTFICPMLLLSYLAMRICAKRLRK